VADDNGDAAALLTVLLQLEGHEVQTAAYSGESVDRAELFRPEVALVTWRRQAMMVWKQAGSFARTHEKQCSHRALTGWSQDLDRRRAHEARGDLHFVKPVDTSALLGEVARTSSRSIW
jgi:DNA-binding response OmpR family regulator